MLKEPYVLFMTLTSITSYVVSRNDSKNGLWKAVVVVVAAIAAAASSWKRYEAERKRGQARLYFDIVASKSLWCVNLLKASGIDRDNFAAAGACPSKYCKVLSCCSGSLLLLVVKTKFYLWFYFDRSGSHCGMRDKGSMFLSTVFKSLIFLCSI